MSGVYVYGVVPTSTTTPVALPGVGGTDHPVRRVDGTAVAALVSDVDAGPIGRARDVRAHWRVLDELAARMTVLPLRFGTVMSDDAAVRDEFLEPNQQGLRETLAWLDGRVQLTIRAFHDEDRLLAEIVTSIAEAKRLRDRIRQLPEAATYYDRIRLGEIVATEIGRRREHDTAFVLDRLAPLAVASKEETRATKETAVNAAFLVERDKTDAFSDAVKALADELDGRLQLRYVGPLPPYSFADRAPAWA